MSWAEPSNNGAVPKPSNKQPQQQPLPASSNAATSMANPVAQQIQNQPIARKQHEQQPQLFDLIGQPQAGATRTVPMLPGLNKAKQPEILQRLSVATSKDDQFPDESFFEMLMKCQGSRIEEQRSSLPANSSANRGGDVASVEANAAAPVPAVPLEAPTVPDEDFFNLIQRLQSGRLEDQRAVLPK